MDRQKKFNLRDRLQQVNNKKYILHIYKYLVNDNVNIISNDNNISFDINELSDDTLTQLDQYIDSITKKNERLYIRL